MESGPGRRRVVAKLAELPLLEPSNREEWHSWLEVHHATAPGVWLAVGKKGNTVTSLTYEDAVQEALAFGWIDSVVRRLDESRYQQVYTPRRPGSIWARSNKQRVERLTAEGRMAPAGLAVVEAAIADGSWYSLDDAEALVVPEDLRAALAAEPSAAENFSALAPSMRKQLLHWISQAKRPETRSRRIRETVESAKSGRLPG
jgi:uncharacterized protein YdeI (YjbR/CyaY-like superfamily)